MKSKTTVELSEAEFKQAIANYLKKNNQSPNVQSLKVKPFNGTHPGMTMFSRVEVSWKNGGSSHDDHWGR